MQIIPWVEHLGRGNGYQVIVCGEQFNVSYTHYADHVVVTRFVDGTDNKWAPLKTVAIPSDYHGKPWKDIHRGMRDHMRSVCSELVRGVDPSGMNEFRLEWAMVTKWYVGQKVRYESVRGGNVLGIVTETTRKGTERLVHVRVTSRKNGLYKCGEIMHVSPTDPWFKSREV
ncbi:hypothetical protein ACWDWS_02505 [Streptomyces sp. NPDC003328]